MTLSPLVLGFWRLRHWGFSAQEVLALVEQAVDLGVTTMDHAMVYGSEAAFGEAAALAPGLRDKLQIVTKCGIRPVGRPGFGAEAVAHYDFSKAHTIESVEASLRDLRTDRIDLLLLHRPDFLMDIREVAETFDELHRAGKVLRFGVSNFTASQLECLGSALGSAAHGPLVTNQIELSPLRMDALTDGTLDQAQRLGMRPMAWSPLAGGRILSPETEREKAVAEALRIVAEEIGTSSPAAICYAWSMALPSRPHPILGTGRIERVREAAEALSIKLGREQWYRIWEASNGSPVP